MAFFFFFVVGLASQRFRKGSLFRFGAVKSRKSHSLVINTCVMTSEMLLNNRVVIFTRGFEQ